MVISARVAIVAWLGLATTSACHRRHHSVHRERDPRAEFATGCVDPRYVTSPATLVAPAEVSPVTVVATALLGSQRVVAWSTEAGVSLSRDDAAPTHATGPSRDRGFALAATSQRFVLAWVDANTSALQAASIDASGRSEAWPPISNAASQPAIAASHDGALLAWTELGAIHARTLDARGRPIGEARFVAPSSADSPAIAWTGARYVVAWRARASASGSIRARTIALDGAMGSTFDAVPGLSDVAVGPPALAWGGGRLAMAWSDHRNGDLGLQVTTVDLGGHALAEPQRLSVRFEVDARASMAWDGGAFGLTWSEPVGGGNLRAYMALVDRAGRRIGTSMRLETDDEDSLTAPAIAWQRPNYLIAAVRGGSGVELRRTGPRGCDMPLVRSP